MRIGHRSGGRRSRRRRLTLPGAMANVVVVALLVAACQPDPAYMGVGFINTTEEDVRITYVIDGLERHLEGEAEGDTIPAGSSSAFELDLFDADNPAHCSTGYIVVRTLDGREIKRLPPPVCSQTWITLK